MLALAGSSVPAAPWRDAAIAVLAGGLLLAASSALAQDRSGSAPPSTLQTPRAGASETGPSLPQNGENLSQRLDRSDGVITPPADVDPAIGVQPRQPGAGSNMPVIPPPGASGSNGTVQPK